MSQDQNNKATLFRPLSFNERNFQLAGRDFFLHSGEMHYFRVEEGLWKTHLEKMKEAGLNAVSTYIPWSLHEPVEGRPDFRGRYAPNLNLERFIELCAEMGLYLTVKPGPYILAELALHGIPKWFFQRYPDAAACDACGRPYPAEYACLSHPDYLEKTGLWYDAVLPFLAPYQATRCGPVFLMQVCNEAGLFQWLGGGGDYSEQSVADYRIFLKERYRTLEAFEELYGSQAADFEAVFPPAGKAVTRADCLAYRDWHDFHRHYYGVYLRQLIRGIRQRGIDIPLFHNVPGWVFGRGREMPVCLSMYAELARLCPDLLLGLDHIPENVNWRNFHDDRLINAFATAIQGRKGPVYIAELQAGTREDNVLPYPAEMELFYKACLANGAVGMNYYMFSQGRNPNGWGIYDSTFYYHTPLDAEGSSGPFYEEIKKLGQMIRTHGQRLAQCDGCARQAVAFYPPYYYRELSRPLFTGEYFENLEAVSCRLDPKEVTDDLLFDGLGRLLAMDNQEFDAIDVTQEGRGLSRYRQVWLACADQMDARAQQNLLDYIRSGGHLICFPTLPRTDLQARPCTILADGLGIRRDRISRRRGEIIGWEDTGQEIYTIGCIETFQADRMQVIARTVDQRVCGLRIASGKGLATVLGTGFKHQAPAHRLAWQKLSCDEDFRCPVRCDDPRVIMRFRKHEKEGGYLFLLNYHNQQIRTHVCFQEAEEQISLGPLVLDRTCGLILPFGLPLSEGCTLAGVSSEVIETDANKQGIQLEIRGVCNRNARAIFESKREIEKVLLNGKQIQHKKIHKYLHVDFLHTEKGTDQLQLLFR